MVQNQSTARPAHERRSDEGTGQGSNGGVVSFRPVRPEDEAFLRQVYAGTRSDEMALVPWSEAQKEAFVDMQFAAQQQHYAAYFPAATHDVILLDDRPIGRLYVERREHEIHIIDIVLLPQDRNAGIGTPIIRDIMAEAARDGKAVRIYVEAFNPSLRLFARLGFSAIEEVNYRFLLEWHSPAPASTIKP